MATLTAIQPQPFLDRGKVKDVLLVITDISGYTRYMTENKTDLLHSQVILTELTQTLLETIEVPLQVSKLEGDAIFLFAEVDDEWDGRKKEVTSKILSFFEIFSEKIAELSRSNLCPCKACRNVDALRLKVVVHYGQALIHRIGPFEELSGVDVITVHRLLKNSIDSDEYLMVTDAALEFLDFDGESPETEWKETYERIGEIRGKVWSPIGPEVASDRSIEPERYRDLSTRIRNEWMKIKRILAFKFRPSKVPLFEHLS